MTAIRHRRHRPNPSASLPETAPRENWGIARVEVRPAPGVTQAALPTSSDGAFAWLAVRGAGKADASTNLRSGLEADGLFIVEIDKLVPVFSVEEVESHSPRAAANFRELASIGMSVWGDVHTYRNAVR